MERKLSIDHALSDQLSPAVSNSHGGKNTGDCHNGRLAALGTFGDMSGHMCALTKWSLRFHGWDVVCALID